MSSSSALISVLRGEIPWRRPVWLMRQAGRYLEEYRAVRAQAGSFMDLCLDPVLAAEVTLQPLRRFDFDAAIVFADILLVPHALGAKVTFLENEGPRLTPVDAKSMAGMPEEADGDVLAPVHETIRLVRGKLDPTRAVIGFCGAPWTVASYMIEGGSSPDRAKARRAALERPAWFVDLYERLIRSSIAYLCGQAAAGADVLQIFDSWAGDVPEFALEELVVEPIRRIVEGVRQEAPNVPIIGFARGIGVSHLAFARTCRLNAVSVESSVPANWLKETVAPHVAVQGNLDPLVLQIGGDPLDRAVRRLLSTLPAHCHIMNLGHGILPTTPVAHVTRLVEMVRAMDRDG